VQNAVTTNFALSAFHEVRFEPLRGTTVPPILPVAPSVFKPVFVMITIFEAPDEEAQRAHLLEIGSLGNVRTTTLRAYNEQEMSGILQRLD
jgi:hypothetical protein